MNDAINKTAQSRNDVIFGDFLALCSSFAVEKTLAQYEEHDFLSTVIVADFTESMHVEIEKRTDGALLAFVFDYVDFCYHDDNGNVPMSLAHVFAFKTAQSAKQFLNGLNFAALKAE